MSARQLRFFEPAKPLLERLGSSFFKSLPRAAGVYTMYDPEGRVLYVGQSKDLRARVSSYKYIQPGRSSRKLVRLVHAVASITIQTCETVTQAQVREYQLLQLHRPKFNTANAYPPAYLFFGLNLGPTELSLRAGSDVEADLRFGAFKSWGRFAYTALVRTLWAMIHQPLSLDRFPLGLLANRQIAAVAFAQHKIQQRCEITALFQELRSYLEGESSNLVRLLETHLPPFNVLSLAQQNLHRQDLELLNDFFVRGTQRNRDLAQRFSLPSPIIPESELDELVFRAKPTEGALNLE